MTSQYKMANVLDEAKESVIRDPIALDVCRGLEGIFFITAHGGFTKYNARYSDLYCKPTKAVAESLLIERELYCLIANFEDLQHRTILIAKENVKGSSGRLDPTRLIVVHADQKGKQKLETWGTEHGLKVISIYRAKRGALPPSDVLRHNLAQELFSADPFQITGPVMSEVDFFGRGNEAVELLRQLQQGRIKALFGIRKVGKTSLINRVLRLSQESGIPRVAMIDCSVAAFNSLGSDNALKALAKTGKMAATRGYAHITEALKKSDEELIPVFSDLWEQGATAPLVFVFDEIDYITPQSPTSPHWRKHFNNFWREFRVLIQEAQRHNLSISLLVSGVSSKYFRIDSIDGIENSALHFIPEEYIAPFSRGASASMLKELGKRCGLQFSSSALERLAMACADYPFWLRMAGSHIHRAISVESRPKEIDDNLLSSVLGDFINGEGAEISKVALEHLSRVYPEVTEMAIQCLKQGAISFKSGRLLVRYGLGVQKQDEVIICSDLVKAGIQRLLEKVPDTSQEVPQSDESLYLIDSEWAEELSTINKRRNMLERRIREFIRFGLKFNLKPGENWTEKVLKALSDRRRTELAPFSSDIIMTKLHWLEHKQIISHYWPVFEKAFGDKDQFEKAMSLTNDRPDAHAKEVDLADLALYRKHISWLEERVME